jgi:hypothetical protein
MKTLSVDFYSRDRITEDQFKVTQADLEAQVEEVESTLARRAREASREAATVGLRPGSVEDSRAWWLAATPPERRAALHGAINRVEVAPRGPGHGGKFDTSRVTIGFWPLLLKVAAKAPANPTDAELAEARDAASAWTL